MHALSSQFSQGVDLFSSLISFPLHDGLSWERGTACSPPLPLPLDKVFISAEVLTRILK